MGKGTLVIFLGAWVALQPFLGLPLAWDNSILALLGISLVGLGVILRRDSMARRARRQAGTEAYMENAPREAEVIEIPTSKQDEVADDSVIG
jgi:hypothetical protein